MSGLLRAEEAHPWEGGASFGVGHRLHRACWSLVWVLLASWTPAPLHRWRVGLLRLFGATIAPSAHVYGSARIWLPKNLTMQEHACLGPRVTCYNIAPVFLGAYSIVSQGAHLCTGSHDVFDPNFQLIARTIAIKARAWIAAEAFVGPGVTVGERAILGSRGVTFKSLEPGAIYAGNPAQQIGTREIRPL